MTPTEATIVVLAATFSAVAILAWICFCVDHIHNEILTGIAVLTPVVISIWLVLVYA